jgi:glycosyltransferase involved in cell wall biosynthesis
VTRLLVVVQRYGAEVVGGSESHARLVARRLSERHDVEVATTNALDFWTWAPHYPAGEEWEDGVLIRRFPVTAGRAADFKAFEDRVLLEEHTLAEELAFPAMQGPQVPALFEFLHAHGSGYDAILFYTYIYAPTALGLPLVPERAILIPTAHAERPLTLAPYRALFALPRALGFLTPEERDLVHRTFRNDHLPSEVLGIGLDPPPAADGAEFRSRHWVTGPMLLYLGQVTEGKAAHELLEHWAAFKQTDTTAAVLVLAGEVRMQLPDRDDLRALGRVSDADKWAALAAADALVLPSHMESLGIALLEAWQTGTPVLVPEWNAVTAGQVRRSGGGLTYGNAAEFAARLAQLFAGSAHGERGRAFVEREYAIAAFDERLERLVAQVASYA